MIDARASVDQRTGPPQTTGYLFVWKGCAPLPRARTSPVRGPEWPVDPGKCGISLSLESKRFRLLASANVNKQMEYVTLF